MKLTVLRVWKRAVNITITQLNVLYLARRPKSICNDRREATQSEIAVGAIWRASTQSNTENWGGLTTLVHCGKQWIVMELRSVSVAVKGR